MSVFVCFWGGYAGIANLGSGIMNGGGAMDVDIFPYTLTNTTINLKSVVNVCKR
jgi:hypothetical protein